MCKTKRDCPMKRDIDAIGETVLSLCNDRNRRLREEAEKFENYSFWRKTKIIAMAIIVFICTFIFMYLTAFSYI